ncbi:trypsin-like peptidase domain-containing protein [Rubrivirga sp. IMCC45206]|uniref:trypsin-like peptidase domain-containing protein n=1 Tax=Rubrivirga sp. IMCC45206 TaxID=3391614 RepID=UPI00398FC1DF
MTSPKRTASVVLLVAAAVVGGIVFVTSAANLAGLSSLFGQADAQGRLAESEAVATAEDLGQAFSSVAERVNPAVVQIQSTRLAPAGAQNSPFGMSPFGGDGAQSGLGSGAFVSADGYVVTNNHVIEDADELRVVLYDGRELEAEVVGADAFSDLAVLRVEGDDFPALAFGDSDALRVGQWVLAFGSPLSADLSNTVTSGIVSSLGRFSGAPDPRGRPTISTYIQTDAAVNPGNSGGPLVNLRGEIVGINSAIATRTGTFNGISFALPANVVRSTVEQIIDSGVVERGYLGISFGAASPALRRAYGVGPGAALISEIAPDAAGNTPAADAGLRPDDLITSIDGVELTDNRQIVSIISSKRPGDVVEIGYNRDGDARTARVTLGRRPAPEAISQNGGAAPDDAVRRPTQAPARMETLGMTLETVTARIARQVGDDVAGVAITDVDRGSEAYRDANLRAGMIITEIDREPVASVAEFEAALAKVDAGDTFLVRVRAGTASFLTALTKE